MYKQKPLLTGTRLAQCARKNYFQGSLFFVFVIIHFFKVKTNSVNFGYLGVQLYCFNFAFICDALF